MAGRAVSRSVARMVAAVGIAVSPTSTVIDIRDMKKGRGLGTVTLRRSRTDGLAHGEASTQQWLADLHEALSRLDVPEIGAVSVVGPLHSLVALGPGAGALRPALLAEDRRSEPDAGWCTKHIPALDWSTSVGSVPSSALTVTKLSWLHRSEPETWGRIDCLSSLHGVLAAALCDDTPEFATDRLTASGTGLWSAGQEAYDQRVLSLIDAERSWPGVLARVVGPFDVIGSRGDAKVVVGTSEPTALVAALGAERGDVIVTIGERVSVFGIATRAFVDESGTISSFASADGGYLPTVVLPIDLDETSVGVLAAIRTLRNATVPTGGRLFVCGPQHSVIDVALRCSRSEGTRVQVCTDDSVVAVGAARQAAAALLGGWPTWQPIVTERA